MTYEEQQVEVENLTKEILARTGSCMENPAFAARDLGFPDHTLIHEAAKAIIARYAARVVIYDRQYGGRTS